VSDVAAPTGTAPSRPIPAGQLARALWRAAGGPLRWLAAAAGIAGGVVRQGLRPVSWRRPARAEFMRFIELAGVQNVPAVVVAGILVGISLVAQGMYWLDQVGEQDFIFTVIAVVLIREIAPLAVGLLAIGRGGLLILDELSELRRDGQCRALDLQGIDPFLALIMPRVLALAVSVFCLTMILLVVAFASGYVTGGLLGVAQRSAVEFGAQAFATIGDAGYAMLPLKTLGIGLAIGVVCCVTALEQRPEAGPDRALMPVGFMRSVLAVFLVSGLVSGLVGVL
jgi:phospholipid/cholesterol/gamma-HCH transport system permease protein